MDYNGDAISDQEWGAADADCFDQLIEQPDVGEGQEDEDWDFDK